METGDHAAAYRALDTAQARASTRLGGELTGSWPGEHEADNIAAWREWITGAWEDQHLAEAVTVASPVLAARVEALAGGWQPTAAQARAIALSLARYLVRMRGRATPFGMFAGVAPLRFGPCPPAPPHGEPVVRARAGARWLSEMISRLEVSSEVRRRALVVTNDLVTVRGGRVLVDWAPHVTRPGCVVSVRRTVAVETVLSEARTPLSGGDLAGKLAERLPGMDGARLDALIGKLITCGVLVSELRPPATCADGLAHVIDSLDRIGAATIADAAPLAVALRQMHAQLCQVTSGWQAGPVRQQMRALSQVTEQPVMLDCRFPEVVLLPDQVKAELAAAAWALARAAPHPAGDPRLTEFHARFCERYGAGALVRVSDLINSAVGLGVPAHFGSADDLAGLDPRMSHRDERLLVLAQQAALDGAREVNLSEEFLDLLAGGGPVRPAPELEICAEVRAPTRQALASGQFTLAVLGTGRSTLAMSGRFTGLMDVPDLDHVRREQNRIPATTHGAVRVQMSFPPLHTSLANVASVPQILTAVATVAEHHVGGGTIGLADLAVTASRDRLHIVSLSRRQVVEPVIVNATARRAWPPVVRLVTEIARSGTGVVSPFAWGAAARLPYLPRVRYRRSVLCPARWRVSGATLPAAGAPDAAWDSAVARLRERIGLPTWVSVGDTDRLLHLNLDERTDRAVLADYLRHAARSGEDILITEAPAPADRGWSEARACEIVVPLAATVPPVRAPVVLTRGPALRLVNAGHDVLPGGRVVSACLYGPPGGVDEILVDHLPDLLSALSPETMWWFLRYRDPCPHLRLRIHPPLGERGHAIEEIGAWASRLRRSFLTGDLTISTYRPETARYGSGPAMDAAERFFAADSVAARAQLAALAASRRISGRALAAASVADLAAAITGGWPAGMHWLIDHKPGPACGPLDQDETRQTMTLSSPDDGFAALRRLPGGDLIASAWDERRSAATAYATLLDADPAAPAPCTILISLLHLHHARMTGTDPDGEQIIQRLARAVALAWSARERHDHL